MTPDRWRDVTDLFHAAVARDPGARAAFLDEACRQDPSLRRSVESLLQAHDEASARGGTAALLPLEPSLQPGALVGPYRVETLIDVGGMGEVYKAVDTQLHRPAALKVLSADLADDAGFQARFEREARLLAALNHPAIAAIYGLEKFDGRQAIAMEFVDGPTLADRLAAGRLPIPEALTIAIKIADALAAAHDKGIVHRDLKPSNIKIPGAGGVKLLDFGIAKEATLEARGQTALPTATSLTRQGAILGTAAYMSPEQARGGPIDKRTDIWAFGCVLFEMLAGARAFDAKTSTDTIAKILEREPDWAHLPAGAPDAVRKLLRRCLKKDVNERLRDISDARLELIDTASELDGRREPSEPAPAKRRTGVSWLMAATLVVVAAVAVWLVGRPGSRDGSPSSSIELGITMPPGVMMSVNGAPISPDGRYVAVGVFKDTARILIYTLATAETRLLPGTEGGLFPFWSADGSSLGFFASNKTIMRIDPAGMGPPVKVCDVPAGSALGAWNADGVILFSLGRDIYRVAAAGGSPVKLDLGEQPGRAPSFVSDNRHFLFYDGPGHVTRLGSLDGSATRKIVESDYAAVFAPPDQVLFIRGTSLMAQTLDLRTLTPTGSPTVVAPHVAPGDLASGPFFSASRTGGLAYARPLGGLPGQLTWFDANGRAGDVVNAPADTEYLNPALSPDGQALAVNVMDPQSGNWDIWKIDLRLGTAQHQTTDAARDSDPVWSEDGKRIAFASNRGGRLGLYQVDVDALGSDRLIRYLDPGFVIPTDWSRDGHYVLYTRFQPQMVWAVSTRDDSKPIEVLGKSSFPYAGRISPDGKWIAYAAFDTGPVEVYVEPFLTAGRRTQITHEGGTQPRWSADGKKLFYWAVPGGVNVVDLTFDASGLHAGKPRSIVQMPVLGLADFRTHYDVTRDGQRFLVRQPAGSPGPAVSIITNWMQRLKSATKESR